MSNILAYAISEATRRRQEQEEDAKADARDKRALGLQASNRKAQQAEQAKLNRKQNLPLFRALGGAALAPGPNASLSEGAGSRPTIAGRAEELLSLPTDQAVAGLSAMMGQGAAQGPTARTAAANAAEDARLATETARTQLLGMKWDRAQAYSKANRDIQRDVFTDETTLRGEFNKDPVMMKAGQAIQAFDQLDRLAKQGDSVSMQAAITAIAQVQEPGLAVRQDDRLAYSGQNPLMEQMVNAYNRVLGGDADPGTFLRLQNAATALIIPHLQLAAAVQQDYTNLADRKGFSPANVVTGTGFNPLARLAGLGQRANYGTVTR